MAIAISYSYKIEAKFLLGDKEESILSEGITNMVINSDYDNSILPTLYLGVKLETSLYNRMVMNQENGIVVLRISRSKNTMNGNSVGYEDYIMDKFTYIMSTDPDYDTSMEKESKTNNQIGLNYKEGIMSLFILDSIDNNKTFINAIIKNSNMTSIIHKYTSHMKMVFEQLHYDKKFNFLIIPPFESVSKLLSYLNKQSLFYRNGYRYFVDFNKTYLLSNEGNSVSARDGSYSTVIIDVKDPLTKESTQTGIIIDSDSKAYVINVNANNTIMNIKKSEDKIFNKIIAIDSYGNTSETKLDISRTEGSSDKPRLERVPYDNMNYIEYLKSDIENSSIILSLTKTEIDSFLITPNKEYIVRNYPSFSEYNGKFVLSYKKEIFLNQDGVFINSVIFGLRKIKNR